MAAGFVVTLAPNSQPSASPRLCVKFFTFIGALSLRSSNYGSHEKVSPYQRAAPQTLDDEFG